MCHCLRTFYNVLSTNSDSMNHVVVCHSECRHFKLVTIWTAQVINDPGYMIQRRYS